ncbi:anti-sigma factor family protein [Rhizobium leucaenae]|uniref:Anti-sigma factor RsiW n=1 Tax=Rhizobium leucaenae TaxID=29450 RepID=A0A7W7EJA4_9HYPH|nr:anti-sigma factor [Rhizobium leucaenae]MBB4566013.1 anti-sigma factor RsiW [Rhizobium leucaenae]MBB6302360.1 anti-sigma factor RsiW [Rhizobium leucaenae]
MPLETRLSAFMDGETSREEKEELERLIASDPEARRIFNELKHGSDVGRKAFDDVLKEPVPLALVRSIKSAQAPKAREPAPRLSRPSLKLAPTGRQALAAALILFVVGGGIGYLFGMQPSSAPAATPASPAPSRTWLDDIAAYHRIYAHQPRHVVEVQATEADEIINWLKGTVGVKFNVPDLAVDGLVLQGARMLIANGKPVGQLIYKDIDGDVVAICFMKDEGVADDGNFDETIRDDVSIVSWHRNGTAYAVVGPSSDAMLDEIANRVSSEI